MIAAECGCRRQAVEGRSQTLSRLAGHFVESRLQGSAGCPVMSLPGGRFPNEKDIERPRQFLDESHPPAVPEEDART